LAATGEHLKYGTVGENTAKISAIKIAPTLDECDGISAALSPIWDE
jgi:hypothetical protein